jgi:hypothetical protein
VADLTEGGKGGRGKGGGMKGVCGKTSWTAYISSCCRGWGGGVQEGVTFSATSAGHNETPHGGIWPHATYCLICVYQPTCCQLLGGWKGHQQAGGVAGVAGSKNVNIHMRVGHSR